MAAPAILQRAQDHLTERRIDAALARSFPRSTHGGVRLDAGRSRIVVENLILPAPGATITLGRVVLPYRHGTISDIVAPAWAQDSTVSADNIRIATGKSAILIPHIEAHGTSLDAGGLAAIFDSSKSMSSEERLAKLTAKTLTAPDVSIVQTNEDPAKASDRLTFRDVALADVVAGKIGTLTASGMSISSTASDKPPTVVESGPIAATAVDLPLGLMIATGTRSDKEMPLATIYGNISIDGFKIKDANSLMTLGRISSTGAKGRPPLHPFSEIARIADLPKHARTPDERQALIDVALDATKSFTLDDFECRDFAFKGDEDGPVDAKLDRLGLSGFAMVKMASFGLDGFSLHTKDANVSLSHYGVDGYDQSALVDALLSNLRRSDQPDMHAEALKMMRPSFAATSMTALHVDVPSKDNSGNAPGGASIVVDFPAASMTVIRNPDAPSIGTNAHAQMTFAISPSAASPAMRQAADAGFGDVDLNADYAFTYDEHTEDATLGTLSFDARNLAAVKLGGQFGKVPADLMDVATDPDRVKQAMDGIVLRDVTIVLTNAGLVEKILPILAAGSKLSVPVFKAEMQGQAQAAVIQALGATPTAERINKAIGLFIAKPKSFTLTIKAPQELSFGDIAAVDDPKSLLDKVDIDAVANQ
ncbi:MAG TPA: hypothetical protein VH414_09040 [Lichenihabitans sp.]|nr:hypothetical protein [Lichenihabitans sp.]